MQDLPPKYAAANAAPRAVVDRLVAFDKRQLADMIGKQEAYILYHSQRAANELRELAELSSVRQAATRAFIQQLKKIGPAVENAQQAAIAWWTYECIPEVALSGVKLSERSLPCVPP